MPINLLIDSAVAMIDSQVRRKSLRVETIFEPGLAVYVDQQRCRQILLNLLSNAAKFTQEGGSIEVSAKRVEATLIEISVSDTGIGISEDEQEKIFSEFYQADRVRDTALGGSGIGLALTRRLVELHGGTIGVESAPGKGSRFFFRVPAWRGEIRTDGKPSEVSIDRQQAGTFARGRILVAEDNEISLAFILDVLSVRNHEVAVAKNGQEAIDLAIGFRPDIIIMDMQMPTMDGFTATRKLREMSQFRTTPIVSLSASADPETIDACIEAGCTVHLTKPIQSKKIFEIVEKFLSP